MAETRTIRLPQFLDEKRPGAPATPASFTRVSSPRAASLRVVTPAPPRPVPTPPPPSPGSPAAVEPAVELEEELEAGGREPVGPAPAVLAGLLAPAPSPPGAQRSTGLGQLETAVERLRLEAGRLAEQARADALEIGFQVARRIFEHELSSNPEALFSLVRSAVRRLGDARRLVIRLHPADAERLDGPDGRQRLGLSLMQVEVTPDATLEPGDCVVESEQAAVDGRTKTRLEELRRAAERALEEEGG